MTQRLIGSYTRLSAGLVPAKFSWQITLITMLSASVKMDARPAVFCIGAMSIDSCLHRLSDSAWKVKSKMFKKIVLSSKKAINFLFSVHRKSYLSLHNPIYGEVLCGTLALLVLSSYCVLIVGLLGY